MRFVQNIWDTNEMCIDCGKIVSTLGFHQFWSRLKTEEKPNTYDTHTHTSNHRQQMAILLFFFIYIHVHSVSFHLVAFGLFSLFERICYLHCAHHIAKKQSTEKEKQNQERMFIFIRKNQQMFFIDVLMNIKWVFIEINTIECVRRAICLLRLFKYILTRTSAISVAACTTFEFSCFFFSSHSA